MKKFICIALLTTFLALTTYANPYTGAIQRAKNVRAQVEAVSNPDNYDEDGNLTVPQAQPREVPQQAPKNVTPAPAPTKPEKTVKECVCPNCRLVKNAKLREKNTKGRIKYVAPDCPCFHGKKCPTK